MEVQRLISEKLNQEKVGKKMKVLIDRKEGGFFVGRTEFDSPEVDNEVLIEAKRNLKIEIGSFIDVLITDSTEYDLYGEPSK